MQLLVVVCIAASVIAGCGRRSQNGFPGRLFRPPAAILPSPVRRLLSPASRRRFNAAKRLKHCGINPGVRTGPGPIVNSWGVVGDAGGCSCDSCLELNSYLKKPFVNAVLGPTALSFGNQYGACCFAKTLISASTEFTPDIKDIKYDQRVMMYSASKYVFTYTVLSMVDEGHISLDDRASELLHWWSSDPRDSRSNVTLRHLLAQTDGMQIYHKIAMGGCKAIDTIGCAKEAYKHNFKHHSPPGTSFQYSETSWYVAGAMVIVKSGLGTIDEVFRRYLGDRLGISNECGFTFPNRARAMGGGGLVCSVADYSKVLIRLHAKTLVSPGLHAEAERPYTLDVKLWPPKNLPGLKHIPFYKLLWNEKAYFHYGLGQWLECSTKDCADGPVRTHSMGGAGTFPWITRRGDTPHWGLLARARLPVEPFSVRKIFKKMLPKVADAMNLTSSSGGVIASTS